MPPAPRPAPEKKGLSGNTVFALGLVGCVALVGLAVAGSKLFGRKTPLPPPPPAQPAPTPGRVIGSLKYTEGYYQAEIGDDAKKLGIPAPTLTALQAPLPYSDELPAPRKLKGEKDVLETPHLRIATRIVKEWARSDSGQGFRYEHEVLEITNRSDKHIAYRVVTSVAHPERCKSKGAMKQNAIALKPGESISRTECIWAKGLEVTVQRVETIELPELGYYYASRLVPVQVLLDERTAAGHAPPKGQPCSYVPWREIQSIAKEPTAWSDVLDFYGRHNCDEYAFWRGYHRWTAPGALPSVATNAAPAEAGLVPTAPPAAAQ